MTQRIQRSATAGEAHAPGRLDQVAARLFPEFSRARLQGWIRSGALLLEGRVARPRDPVCVGETLSLDAMAEEETVWQGQDLPLQIVYEDEHCIVVDKPAGLVVHPGAGNPAGTLVNALLHHRPALEALPRGGIVHRLDKDTSGLLVVAASVEAHHGLVRQLQEKTARREYFAVAQGCLTGGGTIDAPIGRHPRQRIKMAVRDRGGREAVTHYRLLRRYRHFTALAVQLETGRTHQIRVHLAHRGYPLLGDPLYGGRQRVPAGASTALRTALSEFRRQALHAQLLAFDHPVSGEHLEFRSPQPEDLQQLVAVLDSEDAAGGAPP
jgi:23S rRNA pseudouridine1911/1915/1917 synthase